jgi:hypothetical protein
MRPGPNHARAIRARLAHLDRNLTIIERIAREGESGVLFETTPLPSERARALAAAVAEARKRIQSLSGELGLDRDVLPGEQVIGGTCALLWETVVETHAKYLDAYGPVPEDLRSLLEPAVDELEVILDRIQAAARGGREGR